jgi:hypothetical protein
MRSILSIAIAAAFTGVTAGAWAFDSGSTGADGAFNATVNTQIELPPSGVLNYTTFNVASGVTVTFKKNATNTPVVILASGDVTVAGTIDLNGAAGTATGTAGDGQLGDDGQPGMGGPGGFDGGRGGQPGGATRGGNGLGPGGGGGGVGSGLPSGGQLTGYGAAGGGFSSAGGAGTDGGNGGASYGSETLLPLVGGSGGGGGRSGIYAGAGGGGGGGAILIASSGTVNVTGTIRANGGIGGGTGGSPYGCGGPGGGGSGGAIRILATRVAGNGTIQANGASYQTTCWQGAGQGAPGRIRIEAEIMNRTSGTSPTFSFSDTPATVFVAGLPTLRIARVGGFDVPDIPAGEVDVTLPVDFPNPVTVEFVTTGVPVGNTVALKVVPVQGNPVNAISGALAGTSDNATASVQVNIPGGPSVLQASTTYNIVVAQGEALSRYAQGERVEKVRLEAALGTAPMVTLITVSGREFTLPAGSVPGFGG